MKELYEELQAYLLENFIQFSSRKTEQDRYLFSIDGKSYELFEPLQWNDDENPVFFDEAFTWVNDKTEYDRYIFKFGGCWYWFNRGEEKNIKLNRVKYLGKVNLQEEDLLLPCFLGVHGPFEMLNSCGSYKDWVDKAKFLGIQKLGVCEKGSLAGAFKFQSACKKEGIEPIFGMEIPIKDEKKDLLFSVKAFVKNEQGWLNLLKINKFLNVDGNGFTSIENFIENRSGLFCILDPKTIRFEDIPVGWRTMFAHQFYYQLDTVVYEKEDRDRWYLENLKKFFDSKIKPVAMCDAYYVEKEGYIVRNRLNKIAGVMNHESKNQYFKNGEEYFFELQSLFNENDFERFLDSFMDAVENLVDICAECNYTFETNQRHLPRYIMTEEERKLYSSNKEMFEELVFKGLEEHIDLLDKYGEDVIGERIDREIDVIEYGEVEDYFLVLRDIVNWCRDNNILLGAGRGSAAGSLVTYLLGITKVDPMRYGLLFERFLNKGRIKVSLPDIDTDFPGEARPRVKEYMEQRFGIDQVCSVGTYGTLQLKAAIQDFARLEKIPIPLVRRICKILETEKVKTIEDFFKTACKYEEVKKFLNDHAEMFNCLMLSLGQPKTSSIHACAMMIFPDEKTLYEWCPVRSQKGLIVSEWEGLELDEAGFLKEDILGIEQLDKFTDILNLIEEHYGKRIDLYKIPKDDPKVFDFFQRGFLGDVFHFGAKGLSSYCVKMQPTSVDELSDCAALYRPGVMENGYHEEYLLRKAGERECTYHVGTEKILNSTYGLFVYQEQVMALMHELAGMDLVTCDTARKAMGKKKIDVIKSLEGQFIKGYCDRYEVTEEYAKDFWEEIVKASSYLFNKSHSVSYSINGYNSLWLKVHYPIEFWSVTFSRAKAEDYPYYINEIRRSGNIQIKSVDINQSGANIVSDVKSNSIYWAFNSVSQLGDVAQQELMEERTKNGEYFSFDEFIDRFNKKGSSINKSVVENLIYSGAFDSIEGIKKVTDRERLLLNYREKKNIKIDEKKDEYSIAKDKGKKDQEWWWLLQQKRKSGFCFFDYKYLVNKYLSPIVTDGGLGTPYFVDGKQIQDEDIVDHYTNHVMVGGYVLNIDEMSSKKGQYAKITLENNYDFIEVVFFPDYWKERRDILLNSKKTLLVLNGCVRFDSWKKKNTITIMDCSEIIQLNIV